MGKSGVVKLPKGPKVEKVQQTTFTKGPNGKMVRSDTMVEREVKTGPIPTPRVVGESKLKPRAVPPTPKTHEMDRHTGAVIETQGKRKRVV